MNQCKGSKKLVEWQGPAPNQPTMKPKRKLRSDKCSLNSNGGCDLLIRHFEKNQIKEKLDKLLGKRAARAEFTRGEVILGWFFNVMMGAKRLEHTKNNQNVLLNNPFFRKTMSPDTISKVFKELAVENEYLPTPTPYIVPLKSKPVKKDVNEINRNYNLNEMLIEMYLDFGYLKRGVAYEVDIDATNINTNCYDSRMHYKMERGYSPIVVMLGGYPVYLENRNGNSSALFRVKEVLEEAITLFKSKGLHVNFVRIDSAGSSRKVVDFLQENNYKYYLRAKSRTLNLVDEKISWDLTLVDHRIHRTANSKLIFGKEEVRLVTYEDRYHDRTWSIMTNDREASEKHIIGVYNKRGDMERRFSLLNECGFNRMVQRSLKFNTVSMQITMLIYCLFLYAKEFASRGMKKDCINYELSTFIRIFIKVIVQWNSEGKLKFLERRREYFRFTRFL